MLDSEGTVPKHISYCHDHGDIHAHSEPDSDRKPCAPIAIVGMSCRLPGGVRSPEDFWKLLLDGRDGLCTVPASRYKIESFYSDSKPRSIRTNKGYFLHDDPACFDSDFFDISATEAARLDPQQRQLLEVVWECLESAGETNWRGKEIGCYVGVYGEDWLELSSKDFQATDRWYTLATGQFALSNRVSYEFDLQGPSMTLLTGCSSSMVGLHEACQALYSGECTSAIVGGTSIILAPTVTKNMSENLVVAPDGMCKTFDMKANGYGRGEAINAIYIKLLRDAIRDGDPIRAVIRSTATNCDGKTPNITTPGVLTQERLVRKAYKKAGIHDISQTGFFECHGTGTTIGDSAETSVVAKIFQDKGIILGSVKPNIGHSEGASGISGIIKAALSLEHATIPPNIFFETPSSRIPFEEAKMHVPTKALPWPSDRLERASINCFGIGGSNAHVIMDSTRMHLASAHLYETGQAITDQGTASAIDSKLLVVSASSAEALQQRIQQMTDFANNNPTTFSDLAYTLGCRREHLSHRAFAVGRPDKPVDMSSFQKSEPAAERQIVFVFTGQGAQWAGMGKSLIESFESFRSDIQSLDEVLHDLENPPCWSLEEELVKPAPYSNINAAEFSQPLCTALQIGLVNLLKRMGVSPSSVVGHSSGEIAAAYASGAVSARTAILIAYFRGQAMKCSVRKGAMLAVGLGRDAVCCYLEDGVVIACENSPQSVTLSGDLEATLRVAEKIKKDLSDVPCRRLKVDTAYHSDHMTEPGQVYEKSLSPHLQLNKSMLPLFSSVTTKKIKNPAELNARYWRHNLESPVLFLDSVKATIADSEDSQSFLEVGPHSALSGPLRQIFTSTKLLTSPMYIPTLTRNSTDARSQILHTIGCAYLNNAPVSLEAVNGIGKVVTDLPSYPWNHKTRHWHQSRVVEQTRCPEYGHHEILGSRTADSSGLEPSWRNLLRLEDVPWLWDHVLQGNVIFPGAGYIAMAGEAACQLDPTGTASDYSVKNVTFKAPLILRDDMVTEIITSLRRVRFNDFAESQWYTFTITVYDGSEWTTHCQGQVRSYCDYQPPDVQKLDAGQPLLRAVDAGTWYRALERCGLAYGPTFRGLSNISAHPATLEAAADVVDQCNNPPSRYILHPTVIDQCLQLMSVAMTNGIARRLDRTAIPAGLNHLYVGREEPKMRLSVNLARHVLGSVAGHANLMGSGDRPILSLKEAAFFSMKDPLQNDVTDIPLLTKLRWAPDVDLTPSRFWMTPPLSEGPLFEGLQDLARLSCLYVLETADSIDHIVPSSAHTLKFKHWVIAEAARLRSGENHMFPEAKDWITMSSERRHHIIDHITAKWQDDGDSGSIARCLQAIYEHAVDILTGCKSPLEILMENDRLTAFYSDVSRFYIWNYPTQLLGHANPRMRVLEIGAGTGGTTRKILDCLKSDEGVFLYSSYVFTDISPAFTAAAQEEFSGYPNMKFQVLDVSSDPLEQEFEPHSFDLIVASNVLHATPSLRQTLRNVHKLLSANGTLLLHELYPQSLTVSFVMGTLPGWWIGEQDGRRDHPFVSPERWIQELQATGFTVTKDMQGFDATWPFQTNSLMVAKPVPEPLKSDVVLITAPTTSASKSTSKPQPHPWALDVARSLQDMGLAVSFGTIHDEPLLDKDVIFLLDLDGPFLPGMSAADLASLQRQFCTPRADRELVWVTRASQRRCEDPRYALIYGVARTLRKEILLDFSVFESDAFDAPAARSLVDVFEKISRAKATPECEPDYEFSYQDGIVYVGRCHWGSLDKASAETEELAGPEVRAEEEGTAVVKLAIENYGLIDSLYWTKCPEEKLGSGEVEIEVKFVGLNFRDILITLGLVGDSTQLGLECSAIVRRVGASVTDLAPGNHVIVMKPGLLRSRIVVGANHCRKVPASMSLEQAATVSTVFATAIYSLIVLGALKKGQSVLIHSACGGVGLAAIQVCQQVGAEVFATVGNEDKVCFLMETHGIPRNRIFNSRNADFLPEILRETNGRGVDLVLNSLAGELLHASWECVATRGKMIELGKRDMYTNGTLSLSPFGRNRIFYGVDILALGEDAPEELYEVFDEPFRWFEEGKIRPIQPVRKFAAADLRDAFRFMQQGTHMGKIIVEMPADPHELVDAGLAAEVSFSPHKSYLLVGGLGGVGRTISTWMVERGARHLVFLSRSAGQSKQDKNFVQQLRAQGCTALCVAGSVSEPSDVQRAVAGCEKPLAGVLQMQLALWDGVFIDMTLDQWDSPLAAKVTGTWNVHHAVANANLDFFVTFSSVVGVCGNAGQANYAAANAFVDSFTQYRRQQGLPSSSLALGGVEEVGYVSRDPKILQAAKATSSRLLSESEVIQGLEVAIRQSTSADTGPVMVGLSHVKHSSTPGLRKLWHRDARFALYHNVESRKTERAVASVDCLRSLVAKIEANPALLDDPETDKTVRQELSALVTQHMPMAVGMSDEEKAKISIDSLMSIEIRSWARRNLRLEISLAEVTKAGTIGNLGNLVMEHLQEQYRVKD